MARGVPVLYIGPDSDIERFVTRSQGGICFRGGDIDGVTSALVELAASPERLATLAGNARDFYAAEFSAPRGLARYAALVEALLAEGAAPP
jgi:glycosyltransferase involved in cell wall biosynthesis